MSASQNSPKWRRVAVQYGTDVLVATVWAVLVVAIVLFSGMVSQFAYVDF